MTVSTRPLPRDETVSDRMLVLGAAIIDPAVVARYRSKIITVPGSECRWWTGALSGRGHGRFWVTGRHVIIAHRFAFALEHGVAALEDADVLGHRCDNPRTSWSPPTREPTRMGHPPRPSRVPAR